MKKIVNYIIFFRFFKIIVLYMKMKKHYYPFLRLILVLKQQLRDPPTKLLALFSSTLAFQIVKIGPVESNSLYNGLHKFQCK